MASGGSAPKPGGLAGCRRLCGPGAVARAVFVPEPRGDPLAPYGSVGIEDTVFNAWLTERVLKPVLDRWSRPVPDPAARREAVAADIEWAADRTRRAFLQVIPRAAAAGEPALLAAMGVAANLIRTIGVMGEFVLAGSPGAGSVVFRLSRAWCGLLDYAADTPYFPSRAVRPGHAARLRALHSDPGHLRNALWCSSAEIEARCAEALAALRQQLLRFEDGGRPRSGAVRRTGRAWSGS